MSALFALDFTLTTIALFVIAYGVLRLPARATAPVQTSASRRDVIYINIERPGHGTALRMACDAGYKYAAKDGKWITMRRDE